MVGSTIAAMASKYLKKNVMELGKFNYYNYHIGGSDPFLVLKDADVDLAVQAAVNSRIGNCG